METFSKKELALFKKLNSPTKIQDFLNTIPNNFERNGETCMSPLGVMRKGKAHCIEGALLAAYILSLHGHKPLLMDLRVAPRNDNDFDHVVTLFKVNGYWGALSKTNHVVLRYREPIYKTLRELALSYFHEYFTHDGKKNLRTYSDAFDLNQLKNTKWITSTESLWYIALSLNKVKHHTLISPKQIRNLRKADNIEIKAGKLTEYKK